MESLIYYPTFEPPNDTWLKFALIFFNNFKPIVPYNQRHLLSDNFRKIIDNSDLIELYSPEYDDSYTASLKAIDEATKFIDQPYERSYLFTQVNLLRKWQNPANWTFEIFEEKFSYEWFRFCESHNIGIRTINGMQLPEELAFLFMTYLAKEIAMTQDSAIITDNDKFDRFTNYSRTQIPSVSSRQRFAKEIVNLQLPENIKNISINKLIDFRRKNRDLITAFNNELDNIQNKIGTGYSEQDFIDSYKNVSKDFFAAIIAQGSGAIVIPLTTYVLITNPLATSAEYVEQIIGSLGLIYSGAYSIHKGLKDTKDKRYCKKYLTNLKQIEG